MEGKEVSGRRAAARHRPGRGHVLGWLCDRRLADPNDAAVPAGRSAQGKAAKQREAG